ncbi:DUF5079 family protein [Staphylococcus agnetis]|uniref:DUF5079 family protein n=1 Tax=Staphylococcus agnetis TaxID=985762 RepID=UPI0021CF121D|nr:DUF5079 family protein [Staphylococcus agnetis]UXU64115.1 DUF5079 family protein [Staphylococcus agnetis]UXU66456.1 DUF5079 family protein [Staphylococcus agnetis]
MLETYITKLKKSHMTPFIIFMMIYIGFFNVIGLFVSNVWNRVPIIIHIMIIIWIVSCLIIIKQDSYNKIKMNQYVALRYLIVNVFAGYMQPIALSVGYVIESAYMHRDVINHWFVLQLFIILSLIGTTLFSLNEFHIILKKAKTWINILAVLFKILSFALILYLNFSLPIVKEENMFIWSVIIVLIVIDAFLIRSFFFYSLVVGTLNGDFEQPGNASISEE